MFKRADYFAMLITSIARFSEPRTWGGDFTALLEFQALIIQVKLVCPADMRSRKQYKAGETTASRHREERLRDKRQQPFLGIFPDEAKSPWCVLGEDGANRVVEDVTIVLTSSGQSVEAAKLMDIPEVEKGTKWGSLCHFAAMGKGNRENPLFPLVLETPALFPTLVSGSTWLSLF